MTSLLALFSILGGALAGSGSEDDAQDTTADPTEDEIAPVETVTTSDSYVPDWVSVIDALATAPVDESMPDLAEEDDNDAFCFM